MTTNPTVDIETGKIRGILFLGKVVDNNDPAKLQRVKIRTSDLHKGMTDDQLPWARRLGLNYQGSSSGVGEVRIPVLGSQIVFMHQDDSLSYPIYIGELVTQNTILSEFNENYPHSYGFIDRSGNLFKVNTQTDSFEFTHVSGTKISITNGSVTITTSSDLNINSNGNTSIKTDGKTEIYSDGEIHMSGSMIMANTFPSLAPSSASPRSRPTETPFTEENDF